MYMDLTEVKKLLLWLMCFLDVHTTSHSWSDSLTRVNGRMGSTQAKKRGGGGGRLVWYAGGAKSNKDPGFGGLVGV